MAEDRKQRPESIREIRDRMFIHYVALELGIVPLEDVDVDIRTGLSQLSPEEARRMKRKFRKLWRRYAREEEGRSVYNKKYARMRLGMGTRVPSRAQKKARKELVRRRLWEEFIAPQIKRFEAVEREGRD